MAEVTRRRGSLVHPAGCAMLVMTAAAFVLLIEPQNAVSFRVALLVGWGLPMVAFVLLADSLDSVVALGGITLLFAVLQASVWTLVFFNVAKIISRRKHADTAPA